MQLAAAPVHVIVVGWYVEMFQESEQVASVLAVAFPQPLAVLIGGNRTDDGVHIAVKPLLVGTTRAFGQPPPPPGNDDCPQQQRLHAWGEDRARFDDVLAVAQSVRQTDLPEVDASETQMLGPMAIQYVGHHASGATVSSPARSGTPSSVVAASTHTVVSSEQMMRGRRNRPRIRRDRVVEAGFGAAEHGIQPPSLICGANKCRNSQPCRRDRTAPACHLSAQPGRG